MITPLKKVIYQLLRQYGQKIGLYNDANQVFDPQTGVVTRTREKLVIRRAAILPIRVIRDFVHSPSLEQNFEYGGLFDEGTRNFLIKSKDIPKTWVLDNDQYIIHNQRRFNIQDFQRFDNLAYIVTAQEVKGEKAYEIITKIIVQKISLSQVLVEV